MISKYKIFKKIKETKNGVKSWCCFLASKWKFGRTQGKMSHFAFQLMTGYFFLAVAHHVVVYLERRLREPIFT